MAKPLTQLLKADVPFNWGEEQEKSFQKLKEKLITEPVLIFPDFSKPFIVTTDASGYAIGGILSQGPINQDRPIAYTSRTLNGAESRYNTYEKEALGIVYSVLHFRTYLYGRRFTLVTDHKPLIWFRTCKAGKTNVNADALSRNPVEQVDITDTAEIFATTHQRQRLTDEEIQRLLDDPEEDGPSDESIHEDEALNDLPTETHEGYEGSQENTSTEEQPAQNVRDNIPNEPVAGPSWQYTEYTEPSRMVTRSQSQPKLTIPNPANKNRHEESWKFPEDNIHPVQEPLETNSDTDSSDEEPRLPVRLKKKRKFCQLKIQMTRT